MKLVALGPTPEATYQSLYFKSDGKLYKKTSAAVETEIGGGGGGDSFAGADKQIQFKDGVVPGVDTNFTWDKTLNTMTISGVTDSGINITGTGGDIGFHINNTGGALGSGRDWSFNSTNSLSGGGDGLFSVYDNTHGFTGMWVYSVGDTSGKVILVPGGGPPPATMKAIAGAAIIGESGSNKGIKFVVDNSGDIGASGANRPRTGYFGTSVVVGSTITIDSDSINSSTSLNLKTGGTNVVTIQSPSFSSTLVGKLLLGPNIELYRNTGGEGILQLSPSGGVNGIRSSGGGLEILSNGVARMAVHAGEHWEIKTGSIHIPGTSAQGIKWSIPTGTRPSIISPADATLEFNTGTGSDQKHVFKINTVEKARVDTNGVVTSRVSGLTGSVSTDGDALASSGGSAIQLDFAAAAPTTNTRVTRYSTVTVDTGSPNMTLTQSDSLGDSVKIDKAGVFFVSCTNDDNGVGADQQACITRNGTALMSTCDNQSTTERLNWNSNTGDKMTFTSWAGYLAVNDVIRCQNAAAPAVGPNFSNFKVHMLSK